MVDLAKEIERIEGGKRDYVAPTQKLEMVPSNGDGVVLEVENGHRERYRINQIAHEQIGDRLGIPRRYYEKMRADAPDLLARNVNTWFQRQPEKRLVRTLDGNVRAFLSDRYRPLDNYMVAEAALPVLLNQEGVRVKSCGLTERRLYIQAITPKIAGEVKPGDVVQAGIVISNSEVGCGSVRVEPMIYRLICSNGMITSHALKKYHVGRRIDVEDVTNYEVFEAETVEADNKAFMLKVRDIVRSAFDELRFNKEVLRLRDAAEQKIEKGKIEDVVEETTKRFSLSQKEGESILHNLIEGADLSKYGVANSITALANELEDYDRAVELERVGGKVIDLNPSEWRAMNR